MRFTTRCFSPPGCGCAPVCRRVRFARSTASFCLAIASLFIATIASRADDDIGLAYNDLYLQAGNGTVQGSFVGTYNVNTLLGANRFYTAGYTGTNAVMANIEAGYIWSGHETLGHVGLIPTSGAAGEVDRHATWVGMVMGGRQGGTDPGPYQQGMAPDAQLYSGAIALSWPQNNSSFPRFTTAFFVNFNGLSTFAPFRAAIKTGITGVGGTRTADVVNVSWVGTADSAGLTGTDNLSGTFDALLNETPHTLLVVAVGNTVATLANPNGGQGPNRVPSPATGYNVLSVAGLTAAGGTFNTVSSFSNGGPNNYSDPVNGTTFQARQVVDIAAPAESFATAYYGGESGGNGPLVFGAPSPPAGGPDYYSRNVSGTSFSAPTVSGGAALLYDAAYAALGDNTDARDARVMKAVLMNSADKTLGWSNGQVAHPNGNGGVLTTQGLDNRVGTGRMNLDKAFDQFLSGTTDVGDTASGALGQVKPLGWDFGQVSQGTTNDYLIDKPLAAGSMFTATLDWFRDRTPSLATFSDDSYDNLDLELWRAQAGVATALIAESKSLYNSAEHFSFAIPTTGDYMLRVRWTNEWFDFFSDFNTEQYGLAWSGVAVPEPGTIALCMLALPAVCFARRRRSGR